MVLLSSFFNLFLSFSAPSVRRNIPVEVWNAGIQSNQPASQLMSQTSVKVRIHRPLFLTTNQNGGESNPLQSLSLNQLCGLLEHCQLPDVKKFVTDHELTGMHLSRGIKDPDDLVNLGLKAIQARTLFSLISEWKTHGLPLNFDSSHAAEKKPILYTTDAQSPATQAPSPRSSALTEDVEKIMATVRGDDSEEEPLLTKRELRQAIERDFYEILRGSLDPMDADDLNDAHLEGGDKISSIYVSYLLHQGSNTVLRAPEVAEKIATTYLPWLVQEANEGDAHAQHMLGRFHSVGLAVPQSSKDAVRLYELAAAQGHAESYVALGQCYLKGEGVEPDDLRATTAFANAVPISAEAQFRSGQMLLQGWGLETNAELGLHFVQRAADAGHTEAQLYMAEIHEDEDRVGLPKNRSMVLKYSKLAADQGNADAQYKYADLLYDAQDHEGDCLEAEKYYKLAADQFHTEAMYELGCMYYDTDNPEAYKYLKRAAAQGHHYAIYYTGECLAEGLGVERNDELAAKAFQLSADHDDPDGQIAFAQCCEEGVGVKQNKTMAKYYYKLAVDRHFNEEAWNKVVRLTAEGY